MKTLPYVRKQETLEMLKKNDFVHVNQLSEKFQVSYMTINRDLKELEEDGAVTRVYGGVTLASANNGSSLLNGQAKRHGDNDPISPYYDLTIEERFNKSLEYKQAIAEKAAEYVNEGDVIALDPSTTTLHMCPYLQDKNITVVTTSIMVTLQFSTSKTVQVLLTGGVLRKSSLSLVNIQSGDILDSIVINKCFLSSHAISFENGLTDLTLEESESKNVLIQRSKEVFVLVDSSKICYDASFSVCNKREIDTIITDSKSNLAENQIRCLKQFSDYGSNIVFASE